MHNRATVTRSVSILCALVCGVALPVVLYSADAGCQYNKVNQDCSKDDSPCPECNVPEHNCTEWTDDHYTGADDIYTLTQVGQAEGEVKRTADPAVNKQCYVKKGCTQSEVLNAKCQGVDPPCRPNEPGLFCKKCGVGAELPNVGTFSVYPVSANGCAP